MIEMVLRDGSYFDSEIFATVIRICFAKEVGGCEALHCNRSNCLEFQSNFFCFYIHSANMRNKNIIGNRRVVS